MMKNKNPLQLLPSSPPEGLGLRLYHICSCLYFNPPQQNSQLTGGTVSPDHDADPASTLPHSGKVFCDYACVAFLPNIPFQTCFHKAS